MSLTLSPPSRHARADEGLSHPVQREQRAHAMRGPFRISQQPGLVRQPEQLGKMLDRAGALLPAHHHEPQVAVVQHDRHAGEVVDQEAMASLQAAVWGRGAGAQLLSVSLSGSVSASGAGADAGGELFDVYGENPLHHQQQQQQQQRGSLAGRPSLGGGQRRSLSLSLSSAPPEAGPRASFSPTPTQRASLTAAAAVAVAEAEAPSAGELQEQYAALALQRERVVQAAERRLFVGSPGN